LDVFPIRHVCIMAATSANCACHHFFRGFQPVFRQLPKQGREMRHGRSHLPNEGGLDGSITSRACMSHNWHWNTCLDNLQLTDFICLALFMPVVTQIETHALAASAAIRNASAAAPSARSRTTARRSAVPCSTASTSTSMSLWLIPSNSPRMQSPENHPR
jgi:hypothetical protein